MATIASGTTMAGIVFGRAARSGGFLMLPDGSPGADVEIDRGTDLDGCSFESDAPIVARVQAASPGITRKITIRPVSPGSANIVARKTGRAVTDRGAPLALPVAVLPARQVKTAFFIVDARVQGGARSSERSASNIADMVKEANEKILQPMLNVTITTPYGAPGTLSIDTSRREDAALAPCIGIGSPMDYQAGAVRDWFCRHRRGEAHFTVFCIWKLVDPEAAFRQEQFCFIDDVVADTPGDVSYGAYCLAHGLGHVLRSRGMLSPHSDRQGDFMNGLMDNGGRNVSRDDAVGMNRGAGMLTPSSDFHCPSTISAPSPPAPR